MHPAQPCQVDVEDTPSIDGEPKKPAREIVLLVEDNIINMKVRFITSLPFSTI